MDEDIPEEEVLPFLSLQKPNKKRNKPRFRVKVFYVKEKDMANIADQHRNWKLEIENAYFGAFTYISYWMNNYLPLFALTFSL